MERESKCEERYFDENYSNYIAYFTGDIEGAIKKINYVCIVYIIENRAIISIENGRKEEVVKNIPEIIFLEEPSLYTLLGSSPVEVADIPAIAESYLNLRGKGIIVGLIDTGIDYLNNEFKFKDGSTRIESIWDQTINSGTAPKDYFYGSEYSKEQINAAIKLSENNGDPKSIVPSYDEVGHGTSCASIIGATGVDKRIIGAAPECEFIVVKLRGAKQNTIKRFGVDSNRQPVFETADIFFALSYLSRKSKELMKPFVVFLPLGTNRGTRGGAQPISHYINDISHRIGFVVVTGLGNEGDSETHISGKILKSGYTNEIELEIDKEQKDITFQIWLKSPDKIAISIISATGESIDRIPIKQNLLVEESNFIFTNTNVMVSNSSLENLIGDTLVELDFRNLVPGIWRIRIIGNYILDGRYDAWLPQRELLKKETRFLNSTSDSTLTVPSTAELIITAGYYDQNNNGVAKKSGRGNTSDGRIRPDVVCGGVDVVTAKVGGGITTVTGSSMGAATLAGGVALILEWGILQKNDPRMFPTRIRNYLINGAKRTEDIIYPNTRFGYGFFSLKGVFESLREEYPNSLRTIDKDRILVVIPEKIKLLFLKDGECKIICVNSI